MRSGFNRKWFRSWTLPLAGVALAVGVVLAAPLASPNPAGAKVVISGARSLSDQVSVRFADAKPPKPPKPAKPLKTTDVHLLAFNDLHGTLQAGGNNIYGRFAGGAAYLSKALKDRQAAYGDLQATVFAGDNIGATPLENGLFFEEPITIISNLMNVDFASVGNHEFDKGSAELQRIQNGGCRPVEGCTAAPYALANGGTTNVYPGADFQYLSANVTVNATGETLFPAWERKKFNGPAGNIEVGFIGEVLEATPTIVTPTGVAGLTFEDEAEAANRVLKSKNASNVDAWVLVIHEGGIQSGAPALNGCAGALSASPILDIASRLDPAIKVIVSAHTHNEYRCTITTDGVTRLITSAGSFGRILTDITLKFDPKGELLEASATNSIVENALNPRLSGTTIREPDTSKEDPQVQAVVNQYVAASAPLANQVIGSAQGDLTRTGTAFGESTLGNVIADAQLVATQPAALGDADIALMNPGGVRGDLIRTVVAGGEAIGQVTYGEAFTVQPFGNSLVTKTMTGDMLRRLLQQQFAIQVNPLPAPPTPCLGGTAPAAGRVLQVSSTFKYESAPNALTCEGKIGRMWVNGVEVQPTDTFRVTMNNFLAAGGDGFTVFNEGTNALGGAQDIDAFIAYFTLAGPAGIPTPTLNRIVAKP